MDLLYGPASPKDKKTAGHLPAAFQQNISLAIFELLFKTSISAIIEKDYHTI
jgi:hypothetical protein